MSYIECNTTNKNPTYFLNPLGLIKEARYIYKIPSENWPHPTKYSFGNPVDRYYAEIWSDGMDWQHSYWILEGSSYEEPTAKPLIIFDSHEEEDKFNEYDFELLLRGMMWYRRDQTWLQKNDTNIFNDFTWSFLHYYIPVQRLKRTKSLYRMWFEHASQPFVEFQANINYVPKELLKRDLETRIRFGNIY